jgi:hypothetical protein
MQEYLKYGLSSLTNEKARGRGVFCGAKLYEAPGNARPSWFK